MIIIIELDEIKQNIVRYTSLISGTKRCNFLKSLNFGTGTNAFGNVGKNTDRNMNWIAKKDGRNV